MIFLIVPFSLKMISQNLELAVLPSTKIKVPGSKKYSICNKSADIGNRAIPSKLKPSIFFLQHIVLDRLNK